MADSPSLFISLYTDEDITSEHAPALRERGFEAQRVAEADLSHADDAGQSAYVAQHNMAILTCNAEHFINLATEYAEAGRAHAGIITSSEQFSRRRFGELLRLVLQLLNKLTADEMQNSTVYLQQFR